jgi:glycosyltransferase involved in cell wall biosynthesis
MQSFRAPRPTTNPYITMLDAALSATDDLEHLRFDWRRAVLGRYDAFHWHWPEGKLESTTWWKKAGKHVLFAIILLRHRFSRVAVVRTVHNLELPEGIGPVTRRMLLMVEALTDFRIVLNETTPVRPGQSYRAILHGHYRDWYDQPHAAVVPGQLGYFGMVRRYKSLDVLFSAYAEAHSGDPELSLRLGGRPSTPELGSQVRAQIEELPNVSAKLEFLADDELVELTTSSELVVLPYRHMHNSGSVLATLSLGRPVLVPRNEANQALAREVGQAWVQQFDGELDGQQLLAALAEVRRIPPGEVPDLSRREWDEAGRAHAAAYREAVAVKARRRASRRDEQKDRGA